MFQDVNNATNMLKNFNVDIRFHMVIDNFVARFENPENNLPDFMLQIGLGEKVVDQDHFLDLVIREE